MIETEGAILSREFPTGVCACVYSMSYGKGRICVGIVAEWAYSYDHAYCYESIAQAVEALKAWDGTGEPQGWFRNPDTGRRRPNGDPTKEYILP